MAIKKIQITWTKQMTLKSILFFLLHFILLVGVTGVLLLHDKFDYLVEHMEAHGAHYLYAVFCAFLLTVIMYCYFFFENKTILSSGKNIALIFSVLNLYIQGQKCCKGG